MDIKRDFTASEMLELEKHPGLFVEEDYASNGYDLLLEAVGNNLYRITPAEGPAQYWKCLRTAALRLTGVEAYQPFSDFQKRVIASIIPKKYFAELKFSDGMIERGNDRLCMVENGRCEVNGTVFEASDLWNAARLFCKEW